MSLVDSINHSVEARLWLAASECSATTLSPKVQGIRGRGVANADSNARRVNRKTCHSRPQIASCVLAKQQKSVPPESWQAAGKFRVFLAQSGICRNRQLVAIVTRKHKRMRNASRSGNSINSTSAADKKCLELQAAEDGTLASCVVENISCKKRYCALKQTEFFDELKSAKMIGNKTIAAEVLYKTTDNNYNYNKKNNTKQQQQQKQLLTRSQISCKLARSICQFTMRKYCAVNYYATAVFVLLFLFCRLSLTPENSATATAVNRGNPLLDFPLLGVPRVGGPQIQLTGADRNDNDEYDKVLANRHAAVAMLSHERPERIRRGWKELVESHSSNGRRRNSECSSDNDADNQNTSECARASANEPHEPEIKHLPRQHKNKHKQQPTKHHHGRHYHRRDQQQNHKLHRHKPISKCKDSDFSCHEVQPTCGSDLHLYESRCALLQAACEAQVHNLESIVEIPISACNELPSAIAIDGKPQLIDGNKGSGSVEQSSDATNDAQLKLKLRQVKLSEAAQRCNLHSLRDFKFMLMSKFNFNVTALFTSLDLNSDSLIEARELWPRANLGFGDEKRSDAHVDNDSSKDFAFQPLFSNNNCSLSHLMLFDLPRYPFSTANFTMDSFERAFRRAAASWPMPIASPVTSAFKVRSLIGQNFLLDSCLSNGELSKQLAGADGGAELRCEWQRHGVSLSALVDLHLRVEQVQRLINLNELAARRQAANESEVETWLDEITSSTFNADSLNNSLKNFKVHEEVLHFWQTQPYLSGTYECSCAMFTPRRTDSIHQGSLLEQKASSTQSNEQDQSLTSHGFERRLLIKSEYAVQVLAQPHVSLRPQFQWSAPNSRAVFECKTDFLDTRTELRNLCASEERTNQQKNTFISEELHQLEQKTSGINIEWQKNKRKIGDLVRTVSLEDTNNIQDNIPSRTSIDMAGSRLTIESLQQSDTGMYSCRVAPLHVDEFRNESSTNVQNQSLKVTGNKCYSSINDKLYDFVGNTIPKNSNNKLSDTGSGTLLVQDEPVSSASSSLDQRLEHLWLFHEQGVSVFRVTRDSSDRLQLVADIVGSSAIRSDVDGNWNQLTLCGGLGTEQATLCEWTDNALQIEVNFEHLKDRQAQHSMKLDSISSQRHSKYVYVGQPNLNRLLVFDALAFELVGIIGTEPAPKRLHLIKPSNVHLSKWVRRRLSPAINARISAHLARSRRRITTNTTNSVPRQVPIARKWQAADANQLKLPLVQFDIWVLCYGEPLVVPLLESSQYVNGHIVNDVEKLQVTGEAEPSKSWLSLTWNWNPLRNRPANSETRSTQQTLSTQLPLSTASKANNKEQQMRNRKAVHVVQSTFFANFGQPLRSRGRHATSEQELQFNDTTRSTATNNITDSDTNNQQLQQTMPPSMSSVVKFKRSTVITTHHIVSGSCCGIQRQLDLVNDLFVPQRPLALENNFNYKLSHAFVSHYDEGKVFKVATSEYAYDEAIDLLHDNCDPHSLLQAAHGLLIVQCRSPLTHTLTGQLVLDELTGAVLDFSPQFVAHLSYLSPNHDFVISVRNDNVPVSSSSPSGQRQSLLIVQSISTKGLKLLYEVKTSLEIIQCAFAWKNGHYAALLLSVNAQDKQTEILNLRLLDGRLELIARLNGTIKVAQAVPATSSGTAGNKDFLVVSQKSNLVALSTDAGAYLVDLEDNRVRGQVANNYQQPTLLWA